MEVVRFTRSCSDARIPEKAYSEGKYPDAGWDLFALEETELQPGEVKLLKTGIAIELPEATVDYFYEAQLRSRSGHRKNGILVPVGTIDSGYRGDVGCIIYNLSSQPYVVKKGEKICQLVIAKLPRIRMKEVPFLKRSNRGSNGFGSSGK